MSDPTYVRTDRKWSNVCLLMDLRNREIVGHSVGDRRDSDLMKAAFATVGGFPISDIEVFHTDSKNVASRFCGNGDGAVSCSRDRVAAS